MRKIGRMFFILILFFILGLQPASALIESSSCSILIIHSYSIDFQWTQDQHTAFIEAIEAAGVRATYSIEFMDTKKYPLEINSQNYFDSVISKYGMREYDLIYATDNDALAFLMKHKNELFPRVPVIASGINEGTAISGLPEEYHVIIEKTDFKSTLDIMLFTQPSIEQVHIVNDQSTTGKIFKAQILKEIIPQYPQLQFIWVESLSKSEMPHYFQALNATDGVMMTIYFTDGKTETYTDREIPQIIAENCPVPVWCNWDFHLNTGAVGGNLVSGSIQGESAAELAGMCLSSKSIPALISNTAGLNKIILDYNVLSRFQMENIRFSENVVLLNKPVGYLEQNKAILITFGSVIVVLLVVIVILFILYRDQKVIQKKNTELLMLKSSVIRNQTEIVFRMGELIETRSHETANHVRRVSLMSRILGSHYGLDEEALRDLETASAMHDVGKIGIPEDILNKPGKLTAEEREVIQTHTSIGYAIFCDSDLPIFQVAAVIAHQHHEHWSGMGYPQGLCGGEINLYSRIVAIVDVFDALLSKRPYKEPWPTEKAISFLEEQSGLMFDPRLVKIMIENMQLILDIRQQYQDYELADYMCPL